MRIAVVLLTWKRIDSLKNNLYDLHQQTEKNFEVYVSNANLNPESIKKIEGQANIFDDTGLRVTVSHDGNETYTFRRLTIGKMLFEQGYDVVMYIDDDVRIPSHYIEEAIKGYEPKTYQSCYAWRFFNKGSSYYKSRKRVYSNEKPIHYCGTGMSMVDASIFAYDGLLDPPEGAMKIEDLWLSYYAAHTLGWQLKHMDIEDVVMPRISDSAALFRRVKEDKINKDVFLKTLVTLGWELPTSLDESL